MRLAASTLGAALLACSLTFGSLPAAAQDASADEARAAFEAGQAAYRAGRFTEALTYFERAYELTEEPDVLYNVATLHDRLRHDAEALEAYRGYLEARPDTEDRANIEARIRVLEEAIAADEQAPPVEAPPPDQVAPDQVVSEQVAPADTEPAEGSIDVPPDDEPAPSGGPGAAPWILVGVGAALAVGGGVLLGLTLSDIDAVENARDVPWSDLRDAHDRIPILSGVGYAAAGLGVALIAAGVVWAIAGEEGSTELAIGPASMALRGEF